MKWRAYIVFLVMVATACADDAADLRETLRTLETLPALVPSEQVHGRIGVFGIGKEGNEILVDLGRGVVPDEVVIFPARIPTEDSGVFPPGLEVEISEDAAFSQAVRLGRWVGDLLESTNRLPFLRIAGNGASGRFVRVRILGRDPRPVEGSRFATLGEIVVLEKGNNVALRRPVTIGFSIENPPRWQVSNLTDGYLWCVPLQGREAVKSNGFHSRIETTGPDLPKWVEVDLGEDRAIDEVHLVAAHPRDYADTAGFGFPPRFRIMGRSAGGTETILFDSGTAPFPNPGAAPAMFPGGGSTVRFLRVETAGLWRRTNDYIFALAELRVWSEGGNVALGKAVTASDETLTSLWNPAALVDGASSRAELLSWSAWLDALTERQKREARADELSARIEAGRERTTRRWIAGAGLAVLLAALGAMLAVFLNRRRAAREHEALKARLAGDLHDELGASLSHLALQSDLARRRVSPDDPVAVRLTALSHDARETLDHLRDTVWLLSPVAGTWEDLENRLSSITARLLDGVGHKFLSEGERPSGSPSIEGAREIVLFLKEALTNAQKHAAASTVAVKLIWSARSLTLAIEDDGRGFDPATSSSGRGLRNLETRAKTLHGSCRIDSAAGRGTSVTLSIPLSMSRAAAPRWPPALRGRRAK